MNKKLRSVLSAGLVVMGVIIGTTDIAHAVTINFDDMASSSLSGPSGVPDVDSILTDDLMNLGVIFGK
ncbi:MAG TPA: hypothetical protein VIQ03_07130 [Gammaproteobacteria bacterium]